MGRKWEGNGKGSGRRGGIGIGQTGECLSGEEGGGWGGMKSESLCVCGVWGKVKDVVVIMLLLLLLL